MRLNMYRALELDVNGRLIRGCLRAPEGEGPFPTVIFFHGFTVDKVGMISTAAVKATAISMR